VQRFVHHHQREEIRQELASRWGIPISSGEVSMLARKFCAYLSALHQTHAPALRALLESDGGWPMHIDATGEDGQGTLLVIYAGFYGDFVKGGMLSLVLGFVLDSLTNVMPGFFVFFYMTIFFVSVLISTKVFPESMFFVAGFCFGATFAEGIFVTAASWLFYGNDVSNVIFSLYLPQSIVLGALSPAFFMAFNRVEALLDGKRKESFTQL
jgi:rod shape-determining protein MreD